MKRLADILFINAISKRQECLTPTLPIFGLKGPCRAFYKP